MLRSAKTIQPDAWCKILTGGILLWDTCAPFYINFIDDLAEIITASFIFRVKVFGASVTLHKTMLCMNVYFPCCSDTLQAPEICAVVYTSLLA